jgi:hypothetical protein
LFERRTKQAPVGLPSNKYAPTISDVPICDRLPPNKNKNFAGEGHEKNHQKSAASLVAVAISS